PESLDDAAGIACVFWLRIYSEMARSFSVRAHLSCFPFDREPRRVSPVGAFFVPIDSTETANKIRPLRAF
ncbi:MAG: hypothetical protein ACOCV2_01220, partial [Persicimonas sp.]